MIAGNIANLGTSDDCGVFLDKFETRAQVQHYHDRYARGRRARTSAREQRALGILLDSVAPIETALDIPCGTGRFAAVLARGSQRLILADGSDVMLEFAGEHLDAPNLEYLQTDARKIELPDNHVDLAFCHRLLHHIHQHEDRAAIFGELARVTRRYVVTSFYTAGFRDQWRWLRSRVFTRRGGRDRPATLGDFLQEAERADLRLAAQHWIRRFPVRGVFCLFEKRATAL